MKFSKQIKDFTVFDKTEDKVKLCCEKGYFYDVYLNNHLIVNYDIEIDVTNENAEEVKAWLRLLDILGFTKR